MPAQRNYNARNIGRGIKIGSENRQNDVPTAFGDIVQIREFFWDFRAAMAFAVARVFA